MSPGDRPRTSGRAALLGLAVGITVTVVAWGVLVLAAIDFGRDARVGDGQGWLFMSAATVGAIACMFLAIIFAARLQGVLRGGRTAPATSAPTGADPAPAGPVASSAVEAVRPGDAVELDDEGLPPPQAEPEPTYRSRHSSPSTDPAHADTEDSPAAAYRGKRAAR